MIIPRNANSLDPVELWEEHHVRRRMNELTEAYLAELIDADMVDESREAKKAFLQWKHGDPPVDPAPRYHGENPNYGRNKFLETAKKSAQETFEAERKNYVSAREQQDKAMIIEITKKLRFYLVDDEGKPTKLKIIEEAGFYTIPIGREAGAMMPCTIQYVGGDHDTKRLEQIRSLQSRLLELKDFVAYYSEEIQNLYAESLDLATLEIVRKAEGPATEIVKKEEVTVT
jgi:hypothetical protein